MIVNVDKVMTSLPGMAAHVAWVQGWRCGVASEGMVLLEKVN